MAEALNTNQWGGEQANTLSLLKPRVSVAFPFLFCVRVKKLITQPNRAAI